MHVSKKAEEYF